MSKLPRFLVDTSTPSDSPLIHASEAWDNFELNYRKDFVRISRFLSSATSEFMLSRSTPTLSYREDEQFMSLKIEETLKEDFPFFALAAEGLKKALIELKGTRITWNHFMPGEVAALEERSIGNGDEEAKLIIVKRLMSTYPEDTGYVIDSEAGPTAPLAIAMGGYPIWIKISDDPKATNGMNYSLAEMFAIRNAEPSL